MYVSSESHHSFLKAARLTGLGTAAVREVAADSKLRMRPDLLRTAIGTDRAAGLDPFLIAGTAGTTSAGAIDPLEELADVADEYGLWLHTDAAWGGAAALVTELRPTLASIERSHSITFDAHKWLSVPMGAGIYVTRDPSILSRTFAVASAYMPKDAVGLDIVDPHQHSMQWSRRFIGLKVFMMLAARGLPGIAERVEHQAAMGERLRTRLRERGWQILNDTPLPVVCFGRPRLATEPALAAGLARRLREAQQAWISKTDLLGSIRALRACVTNFNTSPADIDHLVELVDTAWRDLTTPHR